MKLPDQFAALGAGQLMNPSPFDELSQCLAADAERFERMARIAEPFGELMARQFAKNAAFTRSLQLAEEITQRVNAAKIAAMTEPKLFVTFARRVDQMMQDAQFTVATIAAECSLHPLRDLIDRTVSPLQELISHSTSFGQGLVEELNRKGAEIGRDVNRALNFKVPGNWASNFTYEPQFDIPLPPLPALPASYTLADFQGMTDDEIKDCASGFVTLQTIQLAMSELNRRNLDRVGGIVAQFQETIKDIHKQGASTNRLVIILAIIAIVVSALQCVIELMK